MSPKQDAQYVGVAARGVNREVGLRVARSVEPGEQGSAYAEPDNGKVSANRFARDARGGLSDKKVARIYAAWELAAGAGYVDHAATLTPDSTFDDWGDLTPKVWQKFYAEVPKIAARKKAEAVNDAKLNIVASGGTVPEETVPEPSFIDIAADAFVAEGELGDAITAYAELVTTFVAAAEPLAQQIAEYGGVNAPEFVDMIRQANEALTNLTITTGSVVMDSVS